MRKPVPIGFEDFKRIIDGNMYYVDKSFMIKNIWEALIYLHDQGVLGKH